MGREWTPEQRAEQAERMRERQAQKNAGPAIIPFWRQATRLRMGQRSVTMCDPRCGVCQAQDNVPLDWFRHCAHDPYVTLVPIPHEEPVFEDEVVDGQPTGRREIKELKTVVSYEARPNTREIGLSMAANSGRGVEFARRKGFILPSEVRSPHYPNGIADACQFYDCKKQTDLKEYTVGTFCREEEAQRVWFTETGTTLEVGEWSDTARQNQMNQLGSAQIGVGQPA